MVLLHLLHQLASAHNWKLTAAHFNHQLRGAIGDVDERLVEETAGRLGLRFVAGRENVRAKARAKRISVEMAGRQARHDFLARTARSLHIPSIALAHHADDQVELFFLRLLRGTSGRGLSGMKWISPSPSDPSVILARPLLDQTKEALRGAAKAMAVRYSEDATNASMDHDRNRVRHELLPLLRKHYQPRLTERVLRLMELAGAETEVVTRMAERWLARTRQGNFGRLAPAVQRSALYLQLLRAGHAPDFELVERLREQADRPVAIGAKRWVSRDAEGVVRERKAGAPEFSGKRLDLALKERKGQAEWEGMDLRWEVLEKTGIGRAQGMGVEFFDADKVGRKARLRHWQPGDRFQPIGMTSKRKLQDLFTDLKVPKEERHRRVVATTGLGELFWVEGLRMSERFKLEPGTRSRLKWQWRRKL